LGIEVLAITDHDTTEGLPAALAAAQHHDITLVPGVEISTVSDQEELHLLGYFVDLEDAKLQALLTRTRQARWERAQQMLARLAELGLPIEWDRVIEVAGGGGSIGRPHVAATLLEAGHVSSWDEAFDLWIGRDCPAYVERYKLSPEDAIQLLQDSGGLAVLAHPYIYSRYGDRKHGLDLDRWLPRLCEAGLAGIEVYYPNYPRRASRELLALAIHYGLLVSGGSDFHGGMLGDGLGGVAVPWAVWEGLERRHRARQSRPVPAASPGR
jgi:predicted metal-dependent phosphoesterase TrpH